MRAYDINILTISGLTYDNLLNADGQQKKNIHSTLLSILYLKLVITT